MFAASRLSGADADRSAVFTVRPDGTALRRLSPWGTFSTSAHWSPDGRWIVYDQHPPEGGNGAIFIVHPDGSGLRQLTDRDALPACCAVWSRDGTHILFPANDNALWTMRPDGTAKKQITHVSGEYETYAWAS